jgi:hypothetical protein
MSDTTEEIAYCNQRAEEFGRKAAQETDPKLKQDYTEMQDRWLILAACYQFPEGISALHAALATELAEKP